MPQQQSLPLQCPLTPSEADLRAVFHRSTLAMPFARAMATPAVAVSLTAAARARLAARRRRR